MPSNLVIANAMPGSSVASAKVTLGSSRPPMLSVSIEVKPLIEPEPYWIENGWPSLWYVEERCDAYRRCSKHACRTQETTREAVSWERGQKMCGGAACSGAARLRC